MKICIDPGHNFDGWDTGAIGLKTREQDITYGIASKLRYILERNGFEVMMTRNNLEDCLGSDVISSLDKRVNISNHFGSEYFISIHCNGSPNTTATGTETYICARGGTAEKIANKIQNQIVSKLGTYDRGVKIGNLEVIRETYCPAVLVETAFISNTKDEQLLIEKQWEFAEAIADGLFEHVRHVKRDIFMEKFNDIKGHYAEKIIDEVAEMGIVNGNGDGRFNPDGWLTRGDAAIIARNIIRYITGK